jgi:hypothetical protein
LPLIVVLVNARLSGGSQFCGMTRFADCLDDWPLMNHLDGLWALDLAANDPFIVGIVGEYFRSYGRRAEGMVFWRSAKAAYLIPFVRTSSPGMSGRS